MDGRVQSNTGSFAGLEPGLTSKELASHNIYIGINTIVSVNGSPVGVMNAAAMSNKTIA